MNLIDSHRRVDEGATVANCRMNRLLFADELVLHAWIFPMRSSARIWSAFCCVRPSRNKNQHWKDWGIVSLKTPKAVYSASELKCTAAGGDIQVPLGGIHEWRKSEQGDWRKIYTRSTEASSSLASPQTHHCYLLLSMHSWCLPLCHYIFWGSSSSPARYKCYSILDSCLFDGSKLAAWDKTDVDLSAGRARNNCQ